MLKISLNDISKRYQYQWIFCNLSLELEFGSKWAITGSNGSGKSTLLRCISGQLPLTEGSITFFLQENKISEAYFYKHLVISAPYLELPEEYHLNELLDFHFRFKKRTLNLSDAEMIEIMYLNEHQDKPISQFSSGMKQRVKLGLCFFSDVPLILLDEPTSNLDETGVLWYLDMVKTYGENRNIIVSSNDPKEYPYCDQKIIMENYKGKQSL